MKEKSDLENIATAAPLFYGFILFCGSLYQYIYYDHFSIAIFKYLDISEILVSFLDILILILTLFGFFTLLIMAIPVLAICGTHIENFVEKIRPFFKLKPKEKKAVASEQKKLDKNKFLLFISAFSTLFIVSIILFDWSGPEYSDTVGIVYLTYIIITILPLGFELAESKKGVTGEEKRHIAIYGALAFLVSTVWYACVSIQSQTENAKRQVATIVTKDSTIATTDNYFYVGRTNQFVFLRDMTKKRTDVIPQEEIKKISFARKNQ